MIIKVEPPKGNKNYKELFDKLDFEEYTPSFHIEENLTIITRIGLFFNIKGLIPNSIYKNPIVILKVLIIGLISLFIRKIHRKQNYGKQILVIHSPWTAGYYHWITECLPKILFCKKQKLDFKILIPPHKNYKNYIESLKLLGFNDNEFEYFNEGKNILTKNLIIANCPKQFGTLGPKLSKLIKETYSEVIRNKNNLLTKNRRIYVTRFKSRGRKVLNEEEVIKTLKIYNFEVLAFENITFEEQIKIMNESEALISIHGAALTNMIFLNENSNVLEFVPRKKGIQEFNYVRMSIKHDPCYVRLASNLKHNYYVQECDTKNCKNRTSHMCDIIVEISQLEKNLELMFNRK